MAVKLEDAAKCPTCKTPGKLVNVTQVFFEGEDWDVAAYMCDVEGCKWCNEVWLVQSNKDGIVYEREIGERGMDKTFPRISQDQLSLGRRILEDAIRQEHRPNGE